MIDDSLLPFSLPSVERKKITAAFDGGRISSDGGAMLLGLAERRLGIADRLAAEITDRRDPTRVVHALRNSGSTVRSNSRITGLIRRRSISHCRAPGSQTPPALRISSSYSRGHRTITQPTPSVPNTTGPMLGGTSTST